MDRPEQQILDALMAEQPASNSRLNRRLLVHDGLQYCRHTNLSIFPGEKMQATSKIDLLMFTLFHLGGG